ncbi:type 1 glutamine amidotransferase domain-containing protein [Salinicoccus roseus]|uniref:General stress protein n=1 Tax=Salinicoccus roseus TaxID=45670 RepID=A0A0C2HDU9_9STAP|nr:type 1 glutamine amidotransferase domain-containing protein [Salinicoccus roseus]KIH69829.1 general stress protein [Salinicoccus roseus]MDB0579290.1 type 1 glutamine amidotransferase [Salinicoccus roseus]
MAKKVAVIMTDMVEDVEYTNPVEALQNEGHEVEVIAPEAGEIEGKQGGKFKADKGIADVKPEDYDAILIPGGFSPDLLRSDEQGRFGTFAKHFLQEDKPTFAICHGPQVLIDTDMLKDRNITSFISVRKDLENAGAKVHDKSVVVCHNMVTSRKPDDLEDFNREISAQLG